MDRARRFARTLVEYPFMTAKVIGAIYVEAMRLRLKGLTEIPRREDATNHDSQQCSTAGRRTPSSPRSRSCGMAC